MAELAESRFDLERVFLQPVCSHRADAQEQPPLRSQALSALLDFGLPKYKGIKCILQRKLRAVRLSGLEY